MVDRVADPGARATLTGQQLGHLQVQHQAGQRMGKHIVHLTGQPLPLGQHGGLGLCGAGLLQLDQQQFGVPVALPQPPGEHRQQIDGGDREIVEHDARDRCAATHHPRRGDRRGGGPGNGGAEGDRQHQGGQGDRREHPQKSRPVALQPDQHGRAGHGDEQHREPHRAAGLGQPHQGDDGGAERDKGDRNPQCRTMAPGSWPGLERGGHHERDRGHAQRADGTVRRPLAGPRLVQLGHASRCGLGVHP
jgi:hypothetical protein